MKNWFKIAFVPSVFQTQQRSKVYERLGPRLNLKYDSNISPNPSLIYRGKVQNLASIFDHPVVSEAIGFRNVATY